MKTQRLRDPVHGLITFRDDNPVARLAWSLIDTPEFQRLRRIRQLGVSEFIYPGATHTRFAHSIGVFDVARRLRVIVDREMKEIQSEPDEERAETAVIAALLHDIGHGPFSHTFERVQKLRGVSRHHEQWSSDIIRNPRGTVRAALENHRRGMADKIADLLVLENPTDIYHAIVSSSFDADRLDYLRRDRMMTGTGAGAIDFDWLMEHVRVRRIDLDAPDGVSDTGALKVPTFCIDSKALPAAEQFLLARYTLHQQVYFHKATRCIESMIAVLLKRLADIAETMTDVAGRTGLEADHPLISFFTSPEPTVEQYLALDDIVVLAALPRMARGSDEQLAELATRLVQRKLYKTLDSRSFDTDPKWQIAGVRKLDRWANENQIVRIKDEDARLTIYNEVGGDEEKAHKKLRILNPDGQIREITEVSSYLKEVAKISLTRYYFRNHDDRETARAKGAKNDIADTPLRRE
jgi:HD superfamily phosphohydrolase